MLILAVTIMTMLLTVPVFAEEINNADGDDGNKGSITTQSGGYMSVQTGYRMYAVDENGNIISDMVDLVASCPTKKQQVIFEGRARLGGGSDKRVIMPDGMPTPTSWSGGLTSNSSELVSWLRADYNEEYSNIENLIYEYFGKSVYKRFISSSENGEMCYLVLEPVMWHALFYKDKVTGEQVAIGYFYGTAYNWLCIYDTWKKIIPTIMNGFTANVDLLGMPNALKLAFDCPEVGLVTAPSQTKVTLDGYGNTAKLGNKGYGIAMFANIIEPEEEEVPDEKPDAEKDETDKSLEWSDKNLTFELPFEADYTTGNYSDEFDISDAIPASEYVTNEVSAPAFVLEEISCTQRTLKKTYEFTYNLFEEIIYEDGHHEKQCVYTGTFETEAEVIFQFLNKYPEAYILSKAVVYNEAFPGRLTYTPTGTSTWIEGTVYNREDGAAARFTSKLPYVLGGFKAGTGHYSFPDISDLSDAGISINHVINTVDLRRWTKTCTSCDGHGVIAHSKVCPECNGSCFFNTETKCGTCNGTGLVSDGTECGSCTGGLIYVYDDDGNGGKWIDCPNCLNVPCGTCNGGEIKFYHNEKCAKCDAEGTIIEFITCSECNGTGLVIDEERGARQPKTVSEAEIYSYVEKAKKQLAAYINKNTSSRNDYLSIHEPSRLAQGKVSVLLNDTEVYGARIYITEKNAALYAGKTNEEETSVSYEEITVKKNTMSYNSGYKGPAKGNEGMQYCVNSLVNMVPQRISSSLVIQIPETTANGDYPTAMDVVFTLLFGNGTKSYQAGRELLGENADDIYEHASIILSKHNGSDGLPIRVHTPVASPVYVVDNNENTLENAPTQLVEEAYNDNADSQLRLDCSYYIKWDDELWKHAVYGEDYETPFGYDDIYNKYVTAKYIRFPFDVVYDGVLYETKKSGMTEWIEVKRPDDIQVSWNENVNVDAYESSNHYEMTPFYIPTFAEECGMPGEDVYIECKVEALNVFSKDNGTGAYEDHTENILIDQNSTADNYVALTRRSIQLSGWIYDFTITGTDDRGSYDAAAAEETESARYLWAMAFEKKEIKAGNGSRIGTPLIRYLRDGGLGTAEYMLSDVLSVAQTLPIIPEDLLSGSGMAALGQTLAFTIKSIGNYAGLDTTVEIVPTYTYVTEDGRVLKTENDELLLYWEQHIRYDSDNWDINAYEANGYAARTVSLSDYLFKGTTYEQDNIMYPDTDMSKYMIGDWLAFSTDHEKNITKHSTLDKWSYFFRKTECHNFNHITLSSKLRYLCGEYDQLAINSGNEYKNVIEYKDMFEGYGYSNKTEFRKSMQQWFGKFRISTAFSYIDATVWGTDYDNEDEQGHLKAKSDSLRNGYLIVNFKIYVCRDGKPYLTYDASAQTDNGQNMWLTEGQKVTHDSLPDGALEYGSIIVCDPEKTIYDDWKVHVILID